MAGIDRTGGSSPNYHDLNSLQGIKNTPKNEALKKVAQEFEAMFVNLMLKNMRAANQAFEEGGIFESKEGDFYRDMFDQQLSLSLSHGKGLGIADALYRQMQSQYGEPDKTAAPDAVDTAPGKLGPVPARAPKAEEASVKKPLVVEVEKAEPSFASPQAFIDSVLPMAKKAAGKLGVNPAMLVAQAALETGWGKHILQDAEGQSSYNLFNIKAQGSWQGPTVEVTATEYRAGRPMQEKSAFRQYESLADSFNDFVDFLQNNPRYRNALGAVSDAKEFVSELQKAGYATDPDYAKKVISVFEGISEQLSR